MSWLLGDLAENVGAECHGDATCSIQRVATLEKATTGDITFLSNSRYRKYLAQTGASAVILSAEDLSACQVNALVANNPYLAYARVASLLYPEECSDGYVAATAIIDATAQIDSSSTIRDNAVIGKGVVIGKNCVIDPGVVIGNDVRIGDECRLHANVNLCHDIEIGNQVRLHPGVVIGADGFGIANDNGSWVKIPQIGRVIIGNNVEIGANTTIDRGAIDDTIISDGVKIDNQVQIGHNVQIGENTAIAGCVGISGSTHIGKRCMIGGATGIGGHISIADDVIITGFSMVTKSVTSPGLHSSGIPLSENMKWRKNVARFQHLDELYKRVLELENSNRD